MDPVEQIWQRFLQSKGFTDDTPIDNPQSFYAEWERFLLNSHVQTSNGGAAPSGGTTWTPAAPASGSSPSQPSSQPQGSSWGWVPPPPPAPAYRSR